MTQLLTDTRFRKPDLDASLKPGTTTSVSYSIRCYSIAEVAAAKTVGAVLDTSDDLVSTYRFTEEQRAAFFALGVEKAA